MIHLAYGQGVALVLAALDEIGPSTARTLADWAEVPYGTAKRALQRMSAEPRRKRRVHIVRWTFEGSDLEKAYRRPVYAKGPGLNATRPPPRPYNTVRRESAHRAHAMFAATHLGVTQKAAIKMRARLGTSKPASRPEGQP